MKRGRCIFASAGFQAVTQRNCSRNHPSGGLLRILLGLGILWAGFACGCTSKPDSVKIGVAMNRRNHAVVEMAVKEINAQGGIDGVPMDLVGLDWEVDRPYDAKEVLQWAGRFAAIEDLMAVIGHSDSASTLTAAAVYNSNKIPQIVTVATNPAITSIGAWTYRLCISDAIQGPALAKYAVEVWKNKRIAVFYVNDDYGRVLARHFEESVRQLGGAIVARVMHHNALGDDDRVLIRETLQRLKGDSEPVLVVLFQRPAAATWTLGAIHELGLRCNVLGSDSLGLDDFWAENPDLTEELRCADFFVLMPENRRGAEMIARYHQLSGIDPDYGQVFAYDAVYLIRDAVLHGGFSRGKIRAYLDRLIRDQIPIEGAGGRYLIGSDHDAKRPFFMVKVKNGRQQYLATLNGN
jgi:branched-chain amino acid transport system substrate-binding protein